MAVDVQITDVHFAKLNSLSLRNGMKLQDIIDEAISDYLEKKIHWRKGTCSVCFEGKHGEI